MARFKVGQTVYSGRGDKLREMVVARVHKNPLLPIHQYTFEPPYDGFACGEQSIRGHKYGEDLEMKDCFVEDRTAVAINTIMSAKRNTARMEQFGVERIFDDCNLFFRPDLIFCEWLRDYANGRVIIDVGSGQGHLVRMLKMVKAKAIGIEPNFNKKEWIKWRMTHDGHSMNMFDVNEILEGTIQQHKNFIKGLGTGAMLVFARPCHSDFVETGIYNMPEGMEALYISLPENFEFHNDLGVFQKQAVLLEYKGESEDDEVVYSVIR